MSVKTTEQTAMMAASLKPDVYRVEQVLPETHDTFTLALCRDGGADDALSNLGSSTCCTLMAAGESAISISGDPDQLDTPDPAYHSPVWSRDSEAGGAPGRGYPWAPWTVRNHLADG